MCARARVCAKDAILLYSITGLVSHPMQCELFRKHNNNFIAVIAVRCFVHVKASHDLVTGQQWPITGQLLRVTKQPLCHRYAY